MGTLKKISIKEFVEKGFLQEANRLFFHPLGMALTVKITDNGEFKLAGIQDAREDKTGIIFDIHTSEDKRKNLFLKNKIYVSNDMEERLSARLAEFGFDIEPIPNDNKE